MRTKNQRKPLRDSNFEMGLTTKKLQSQIVTSGCPHYYELTLPNGTKRHCGTLKDVECLLSIYPDAVYAKILLPPTPDTVDVPYIRVAPDLELPMQQILPESNTQPLNL